MLLGHASCVHLLCRVMYIGCLYYAGPCTWGVFIMLGHAPWVSLLCWTMHLGCLYHAGPCTLGVFIMLGHAPWVSSLCWAMHMISVGTCLWDMFRLCWTMFIGYVYIMLDHVYWVCLDYVGPCLFGIYIMLDHVDCVCLDYVGPCLFGSV